MAKAQTSGMQGPIAHTYIAVVDPATKRQTRTSSCLATSPGFQKAYECLSNPLVTWSTSNLCKKGVPTEPTHLLPTYLRYVLRLNRSASPRPQRAPSQQPVRTPRVGGQINADRYSGAWDPVGTRPPRHHASSAEAPDVS